MDVDWICRTDWSVLFGLQPDWTMGERDYGCGVYCRVRGDVYFWPTDKWRIRVDNAAHTFPFLKYPIMHLPFCPSICSNRVSLSRAGVFGSWEESSLDAAWVMYCLKGYQRLDCADAVFDLSSYFIIRSCKGMV